MPIIPFIILTYIISFCVIFFTFFSAKIAQMKLRSGAWGALGLLLGPVGMLIVCYLPSKRKDGKETNPIRSGIRALPKFSRKLLWVLLVLLGLALVVLYFVNNIPKWQENRAYANSIGASVKSKLTYTSSVEGAVSAVAAGRDSTYAVTEDGSLYVWGYNYLSLSQEDKGAVLTGAAGAAQMGREVYVLKKNGNLYRYDEDGKQTLFGENVKQVVCSDTAGLYIKTSGDMYVWGSNAHGQFGGANDPYLEKPLWLCGSVSQAALGSRHLLVLKTDGSVMACGSNATGALGDSADTSLTELKRVAKNCKAVAAGAEFSLILTKDGTLQSAGQNNCGQLGRAVSKEQKEGAFCKVADRVTAIGAGGSFGFYISADNELYTWGQNHCGQLGQGNTDSVSEPQRAADQVTAAAASANHLVILSEGKLYTCGNNSYGQLGKTGETHLSPAAVVSVKK